MRQKKKTKPVAIKELIDQFFKDHKDTGNLLESQIISKWSQIMPEGAERYANPVIIKNKTLVIAVSNSAWLHQLTFKKREIINRIRYLFNSEEITDIRFKIGK